MVQRNSYIVSATCYGLNAEKRYRVDVVDYSILADDVENIKYLGNLACSHAGLAGCFEKIRRAIQVKPHFDPLAGYLQFRHNEIS